MVTAQLQDASSLFEGIDAGELQTRLLRTSVVRTQLVRYAMRGMNASEAAKVVGIHPSTARMHYADPDFRKAVLGKVDAAFAGTDAAFLERTKSLTERLEEQAAKSFEELQEMLVPEGKFGTIAAGLRYRVHKDFLDRHAETAPVSRVQVKLDPMQLKVAAVAAAEMDDAPGKLLMISGGKKA